MFLGDKRQRQALMLQRGFDSRPIAHSNAHTSTRIVYVSGSTYRPICPNAHVASATQNSAIRLHPRDWQLHSDMLQCRPVRSMHVHDAHGLLRSIEAQGWQWTDSGQSHFAPPTSANNWACVIALNVPEYVEGVRHGMTRHSVTFPRPHCCTEVGTAFGAREHEHEQRRRIPKVQISSLHFIR